MTFDVIVEKVFTDVSLKKDETKDIVDLAVSESIGKSEQATNVVEVHVFGHILQEISSSKVGNVLHSLTKSDKFDCVVVKNDDDDDCVD